MAPQVVLTPLNDVCVQTIIGRLKNIKINDSSINVHITKSGDIRLELSISNQSSLEILDDNKIIAPDKIGIDNINLQDASAAYAYHIPEGIMLHYNPKKIKSNQRKTILDLCEHPRFCTILTLKV